MKVVVVMILIVIGLLMTVDAMRMHYLHRDSKEFMDDMLKIQRRMAGI